MTIIDLGLIRSTADAENNQHPTPIFVYPTHFETVCIACGCKPVAVRRSTLQAAIADRIAHERTHAKPEAAP